MKKIYYVLLLLIVIAFGIYTYSVKKDSENKPLQVEPSATVALKEIPLKKTFTIQFVGDILPARAVELTMRKKGYDYPFLKIKENLSAADITFANLESPLVGTATSGRTTPGGTTVFRGDVDFAKALHDAGIDIVSLANNHMGDQGRKGIESTLIALDASGVRYVGAGLDLVHARKMNILEITEEGKPFKVGFLAYNDADVVPESYHAATDHAGSNIMEIQKLKEDISQNREMVDLLVISMHSGTEYAKTANSRQTEFARAAIDNGADMVIGHHPHVLQPIEVYKGKYIFYSLGNFIFDQPWPDTKQSVLARMKIAAVYDDQKWHIKSFQPEIKPLAIQNFQPEMIMDNNSSQFKAVLARFRFPYSLLTLGDQTVLVGMATTTETRTKGLSGTRELTKGQGLLFRFDEVKRHGIWMKDMNYPIDIYWFDDNFTLVHKEISVPPESFPNVFYPLKPARYVLETRVGELEGVSLTADLTGILTEVYYYDKK